MHLVSDSPRAVVLESVSFAAGPHCLRGELAYPEVGRPRGTAVLAGPHPLLGGNMHNNVVAGLGDALAEKQVLTLRFDYRGTGQSEGPQVDLVRHLAQFWKTSHAPDELDLWQDVQGAVEFAEGVAGPDLPLALLGYSFGCTLLSHIRPTANLAALVLIAPTVGKHDYDSFMSVKSPILVIASEDDFALDRAALRDWFDRLCTPKELIQQRCDNHFFRGHEGWLAETVHCFLEHHWGENA
jgi:alpha/beta superfamily hydrolase